MIDYNITFEQQNLWEDASCVTIEIAAEIIGCKLGELTGLSASENFSAVFGPTYMRFTPSLVTHALALWSGIRFQSNEVIRLPLVVHELGHLFSVRAKNKPTKQLWLDRNKLDTRAGSGWPGMHPPSIAKYNVVEQWVNAWEVWVMGLYAHDANGITPAGRELRAWMDEHLPAWIEIARAK